MRIADLYSIKKGKKPGELRDPGSKGDVRFIQIKDLRDDATLKFCRRSDDLVLCENDDLLIVWDGAYSGLVASGLCGAIGSTLARLRPLTDKVLTSYSTRYLHSQADEIRRNRTGATIPHVNGTHLKNTDIPIVPLPEQSRIAEILDSADALRAKRRASITQLDTLLQSIFADFFGDAVTNPMKWDDSVTLGEVADISSGLTKGRKLNGQVTREVPYLAVVNVQDRNLVLDPLKKIEATENEIKRYQLKNNDLLMTEGGDPDKLGRGTLWRDELDECIHQNHIFRVRLHDDRLQPVYLNWLVGSERGKRYFLRQAKQTTGIATINLTQLRKLPLLIPSLELQNRFAAIVEAVEQQKAKQRAHLDELDALFASLQSRAFRGGLQS